MPDPPPLVENPTDFTTVAPDLLDDLPPFEQSSRVMQAVTTAVGNELGRIEAARLDLIANWFPASADALLRFFEQMLGLPLDPPNMTLADRRNLVLAFMRGLKTEGTGLAWESTMTTLIGNNWSYQEHDPADPSSPAANTILIRLPYLQAAPVPTGVGLTPTTGTGTLPAGTYFYGVTATTPYGETTRSTPVSATLTAAGEIAVAWTANTDPATNGYRIYRGGSATTLELVGSVSGAATATFTDDGSATPGVSPPATDTSGSQRAATALRLARAVTPAHIEIEVGYTAGFIIGVSDVGIDAL